jgi:MFS family permease
MVSALYKKAAVLHPQFYVYVGAVVLAAAASGIFETTFNNYLNDTFHIGAAARGMLEFPRELPGLLCAVGSGILFFLPEAKMAGIAFGLVGLGMLGLSTAGSSWPLVLAFMIVWSGGTHLQMPVLPSITMSLATEDRRGRRLGQLGAISRIGTIAGCLVVWVLGRHVSSNYALIFVIGGCAGLLSGLLVASLRGIGVEHKRPKLILQRRYWLYYALELFYGARKQIFITFGPWVLVKIFGEPPATFAKLWVVSSILGIFVIPAVGHLTDRIGERPVLMLDAILIICACITYGFAETLLPGRTWAVRALYAAYVVDQLLFSAGIARTTYVSKVAASPTDVGQTLSVGVSINHAVSMSVPTVGGLVWDAHGYQYVFIGAAGVGLAVLVFSSLMRLPAQPATNVAPPASTKDCPQQ